MSESGFFISGMPQWLIVTYEKFAPRNYQLKNTSLPLKEKPDFDFKFAKNMTVLLLVVRFQEDIPSSLSYEQVDLFMKKTEWTQLFFGY